ncbi:DNA adenine methylase [Alkalibacter mobilis]|uniref:DNA adenine methylase n=1 Tax=Alkalibacter mobilis TaxID=2787712 RepID=UPI0018A102AE|nr:DNA adenine methylase [Alkalibacter mobilis]MBF7097589.1 DNA adenine methylase [Alkalibacter mobilis]
MKSPISWVGGKSRMVKKLLPMIPNHSGYVEVFGGAGWLLFGKDPANWEVLNDFDSNLMNFWAVVKTAPQQLIQSFEYTLVSRELFNEYKIIYNNNEYEDCIQRAHIFYYLIKAGFGSKMKNPSFGTGKCNSNLNMDNISNDIMAAYQRLKKVRIENKSFEDIIKIYDNQKTLFFMDPPYRNTCDYAVGHFTDDQYLKLAELCLNINGKFIITINNDEFIRSIFDDFNIYEHNVNYSLSKNSSGRRNYGELIITN